MKMRLSKSKLLTYDQCPLRYKYENIDGIRAEASQPMIMGKKLHTIFENFHRGIGLNKKIGRSFFITEMNKLQDGEYLDHLKNFIDFNETILKNGGKENFKPIAIEQKYYDEKLDIVGVIDAVYQFGDSVLILDYKTGKHREGYESKYRFELAIYVHLYNLFNPDKKATHWGIYFSKTNYLWKEKVKPVSMTAMYKKVERLRAKIESGEYEPKYSPLCRWCFFYNKCFG